MGDAGWMGAGPQPSGYMEWPLVELTKRFFCNVCGTKKNQEADVCIKCELTIAGFINQNKEILR